MEKYLDGMRRTIDLSDTCLEGLEHIRKQLNEGYIEDTIPLMVDVITAFSQIEDFIQPILVKSSLSSNHIESLTSSLRNALDHAVTAYNQELNGKVVEIFQFTLLPAFRKWKSEVERVFQPYLLS